MDSTPHAASADRPAPVPGPAPSPRSARWPVVAGFVVWSAGLVLWQLSWVVGLVTSVAGGALLADRLGRLTQGSSGTSPRGRAVEFWVAISVGISLLLIAQGVAGVSRNDFATRVALVSLGTLGIILVLLHSLDERLAMERRLAQRSLTDERRRLAGEVHDVVGHTLAASMLHTTAARLSVRSDPDAAIASLERAEEQGRRSMDDIRSVVRLLRDAPGSTDPTPLVGELPELVEAFRSAGAEITAAGSVHLDNLPAATALTAYRVVQEGLTNAVRHGAGAIELATDAVGDDHVDIRISNDVLPGAGATSGGSGIAGMRERLSAIGGTLEAGPTNGGRRWVLHARIPA